MYKVKFNGEFELTDLAYGVDRERIESFVRVIHSEVERALHASRSTEVKGEGYIIGGGIHLPPLVSRVYDIVEFDTVQEIAFFAGSIVPFVKKMLQEMSDSIMVEAASEAEARAKVQEILDNTKSRNN